MDAIFPTDPSRVEEFPNGLRLTIPGGMRVPENFPYVETYDQLLFKCEAAWRTFGVNDSPLNFRLVGPPGVGKNAAVYALAARRNQPLYILLGNEELVPEDLVVTATLRAGGQVEYIASPLLAAMLNGGLFLFDEIAKLRPRALAPLASALDERRSLYSALLGETFYADSEFRFCAAYNPTDADAFDLAPWLRRRTLPEFKVEFPDWDKLELIVKGQGVSPALFNKFCEQANSDEQLAPDPGTMMRFFTFYKHLEGLRNHLSGRKIERPSEIDEKNLSDTEIYNIAYEHILKKGISLDDMEGRR